MTPFAALLLTLALANASDTVSTLRLNSTPGIHELNPLVRPQHPGWFVAEVSLGTMGEVWALRRLHRHHAPLAWVVAGALTSVEVWAVSHNTRLYQETHHAR